MSHIYKVGDQVRTKSVSNSDPTSKMYEAHEKGVILTITELRRSEVYKCNAPGLRNGPWNYREKDLELYISSKEELLKQRDAKKISDKDFLDRLALCKEEVKS